MNGYAMKVIRKLSWYAVLGGLLVLVGCTNLLSDKPVEPSPSPSPIILSSAKLLTGFSFAAPAAIGTIDHSANTVALTVPYQTSLIALIPTITASDKASISPASGVPQDFSAPVKYTVTAEDASTQDYLVTVTKIAAGTGTELASLTIDAGTLSPTFLAGTMAYAARVDGTVTSINVIATKADSLSTVSISPVQPMVLSDGDNPISVEVTAESGATQVYTLSVYRIRHTVLSNTYTDSEQTITIPADAVGAKITSLTMVSGQGGQGGGGGGGASGETGRVLAGDTHIYGGGGGGGGNSGIPGAVAVVNNLVAIELNAGDVLKFQAGIGGMGGAGGNGGTAITTPFSQRRNSESGIAGAAGSLSQIVINGSVIVHTEIGLGGSGGAGGGPGATPRAAGQTVVYGAGGVGTPPGETGGVDISVPAKGGVPPIGPGMGGPGGSAGIGAAFRGNSGLVGTPGAPGANGSITIIIEYDQ